MSALALAKSELSFTPRKLVLDLLDADPDAMGTSSRLLAAGEVFGFSNNQMRVALSRLVANGLLDNARRGHYLLTGAGAALREEIQHWRSLERRVTAWQGDWCAVLTHNLAAEGSSQFRSQTRALRLRGLRRWRPGLWVRPNNLVGGLARLTADLSALGLDALQGSFLIEQPDAACAAELQQLWQPQQLDAEYRQRLSALRRAARRLRNRDRPDNLMETIKLGGDTVRFLLSDPLLPETLIDGSARRALIDAMDRYDREGREQWRRFIDALEH